MDGFSFTIIPNDSVASKTIDINNKKIRKIERLRKALVIPLAIRSNHGKAVPLKVVQ